MLRGHVRHRAIERVEVAEVDDPGIDIQVTAELLLQPLEAVRIAVNEDERGAILGREPAELCAEPTRGPRDERLGEAPPASHALRGAADERRQPGCGARPEAHLTVVPRRHAQELDAEAGLVVDVDH